MSTTYTILEHLWGSALLREGFAELGASQGDPNPSLHSMFSDLTHGMAHLGYDWYAVVEDETGPSFQWAYKTADEWDLVLGAMSQDIADRIAKRMLEGLEDA